MTKKEKIGLYLLITSQIILIISAIYTIYISKVNGNTLLVEKLFSELISKFNF